MDAPKDETGKAGGERRAKILREAASIFYEKGFEGACIDDLIARVGGSKRTIYNEFGSKEGLFNCLVAELVSEHSARLVADLDADEKSGADIRQVLLDFARHLIRIVMDPEVLALHRIVIAEGKRFSRLAEIFYEKGPGRSTGRLAQILERHRARGEIALADCAMAAEQFCGMIRDIFYMGVLLGVRAAPSGDEMDARAATAVDTFLGGVKAPQSKGGQR